ncbi:MAG: hypothetical protein ACRD1Y_06100 [Terriglobales bacterium]
MTTNKDDIFAYAAERVKNKSVLQRIGHSGYLHSTRSAVSSKGSGLSKGSALVFSVGRAALKLIPVPVVGSILGAIQKKAEDYTRKKLHTRSLRAAVAAKDDATRVKFELKELSVENLDRYRWKLQEAMKEMETAVHGFDADLKAKADASAFCHAYLNVAMACAQAARRVQKLKGDCSAIKEAVTLAIEWADKCDRSIADMQNQIQKRLEADRKEQTDLFEKYITDDIRTAHVKVTHGGCDQWCMFLEHGKADSWATCKTRSAAVARFLSAPFDTDVLVDMGNENWVDKAKSDLGG